MKKVLCILICAMIAVLSLSACGGQSASDGHIIYAIDENNGDSITATFFSTDSDEKLEVKMTKQETTEKGTQFAAKANTAKFDRVIFTVGDKTTEQLSFNDYVEGWVLGANHFYPYDTGYPEPEYKRVSFDYENRRKDILIWTPDNYDPNGSEKYSVIYMTDGQNLFKRQATSYGSWGVAESVRAMNVSNGNPCIIVGIENADGWRDNELTPDLGEVQSGNVDNSSYKEGHGEYFSNFVVDTVMPYINENYNVYTDREHTHICGSSSGGIECFYIAMEHPDLFSSVGALSPAFILYSDQTWVEYLSKKDFSKNAPFIYLYCGNAKSDNLEQMLYTGAVTMPDNLKKIGYPADKVTIKLYDDGVHNEMYWRAVFPDYLKYAFPKQNATIDER